MCQKYAAPYAMLLLLSVGCWTTGVKAICFYFPNKRKQIVLLKRLCISANKQRRRRHVPFPYWTIPFLLTIFYNLDLPYFSLPCTPFTSPTLEPVSYTPESYIPAVLPISASFQLNHCSVSV